VCVNWLAKSLPAETLFTGKELAASLISLLNTSLPLVLHLHVVHDIKHRLTVGASS